MDNEPASERNTAAGWNRLWQARFLAALVFAYHVYLLAEDYFSQWGPPLWVSAVAVVVATAWEYLIVYYPVYRVVEPMGRVGLREYWGRALLLSLLVSTGPMIGFLVRRLLVRLVD